MPHEHYIKQNKLLAALPAVELKSLKPRLELVQLRSGDILVEAGKRPQFAYFPVDSVISLYARMESGVASSIAMIGNEGMYSVAQVLGGDTLPFFASVQNGGHAFRIDSCQLKERIAESGEFSHILLLYSQAILTQIAQTGVCGRHHSLEQQLCLHLLLIHDRSLTDHFILTHESVAHMLGARRESVTEAAGRLRDAGLIDYKRGHVKVLDRSGLEAHCCECYQVVTREFKRLLG
jgi:CRP-like cAMP-binding protein